MSEQTETIGPEPIGNPVDPVDDHLKASNGEKRPHDDSEDSTGETAEGGKPESGDGEEGEPEVKLSKRQLKKLKKDQMWKEGAAARREHRKQKRKAQQEKKKAEREAKGAAWVPPPARLIKKMKDSDVKQRVVIDLGWEEYMNQQDMKRALKQVERSYSTNRRSANPLQLYITDMGPKVKEILYGPGFNKPSVWDVHLHDESYMDIFDKKDIVYLTADSPNVLDTLDESKVYIIGGLVDHNFHKGICYKRANEQGIAHAQLPIGSFIQMTSRKVLTINQVFEILLGYTELKDWKTSFLNVIPERKGAVAIERTRTSSTTKDIQVEDPS